MSFFKLLSQVFKKEEQISKSEIQRRIASVTLPKTAKQANCEKAEYMRRAAEATLELCTDIPDEIKKALIELFPKVGFYTTAETSEARNELFKLLDGLDWKWSEWEYWKSIAIELGKMTTGMSIFCNPNENPTPKQIFNLMCHTIQSRAADLEIWEFAIKDGLDTKCDAVEKDFLWETINPKRKKKPWYKSYGPEVPGMIITRQILY